MKLLQPLMKYKTKMLCQSLSIGFASCHIVTEDTLQPFIDLSEKCVEKGGYIKLAYDTIEAKLTALSMI